MQPFRAPWSPHGRIGPRPFAVSAIMLYLASFLSQALLAAPVMARFDLWPFGVVQTLLLVGWLELHAYRLRDAGRGIGTAVGIAILYALAIVLLLLVVGAMSAPDANPPGGSRAAIASIIQLFVVLYLIGQILGDPKMTGFGLILLGFIAIIALPVLVAIGFSIRTGLRASVPASAPVSVAS
jgi:hypothetical protein